MAGLCLLGAEARHQGDCKGVSGGFQEILEVFLGVLGDFGRCQDVLGAVKGASGSPLATSLGDPGATVGLREDPERFMGISEDSGVF